MMGENGNRQSNKQDLAEEEAKLKEYLGRYTVEEPSLKDTAQFAAMLTRQWEESQSAPPHRKERAVQLLIPLIRSHLRLFNWKYVLLSLALSALAFVAEFIIADEVAIRPFLFTAPLLAALTVCLGFRSYGTPMFELELSMPANPLLLIFSRLTLIVAYYLVLGSVLTVLLPDLQHRMGVHMISWLIPLGIFSLVAALLLFYFGVFAGLYGSVVCWIVQLLLNKHLGILFWFSEVTSPQRQQSQMVGLVFILLLSLLLIHRVRRMSGRRGWLRYEN